MFDFLLGPALNDVQALALYALMYKWQLKQSKQSRYKKLLLEKQIKEYNQMLSKCMRRKFGNEKGII